MKCKAIQVLLWRLTKYRYWKTGIRGHRWVAEIGPILRVECRGDYERLPQSSVASLRKRGGVLGVVCERIEGGSEGRRAEEGRLGMVDDEWDGGRRIRLLRTIVCD